MMLAKCFLRTYNRDNLKIFRSLCSLLLFALLAILGCSDTAKKTRGEWKTVLKGDWSAHLNDVHFISETHGWTVGNSSRHTLSHRDENTTHASGESSESIILHTSDGGKNWKKQNSGIFGKPLNKVYFKDNYFGWSVGEEGTIIHTDDGGKSWKQVDTPIENNLHSLHFKDEICWVVGDWGIILKSIDLGKTFERVDENFFNKKSLKDVYFINKQTGWVVTYNNPNDSENAGYIYNTTDGGTSWQPQFSTKSALFSIIFIDEKTGWVVGDQRSIYYTTNGGKNWESLTHGSNERHKQQYGQPEYLGNEPLHTFTLYDIDFADTKHGWIVGDLGVILSTTHGTDRKKKIVWKHQRGGPRFHNSADGLLLGVDFVSKTIGWAVGENGTILHTRNGGVTWNAQSNPTHLLYDVCLTTQNHAYVVGDRGAIMQSIDGGVNWRAQDSRTAECFSATHFVSHEQGWAAAEAGVILHTIHGGEIWLPQESNTKQDLLTLFFIDKDYGWAAGSAGEIVHTNNGGITWTPQKSGVSVNLFDIHFTSKSQGWVAGMFGTLLFTLDSGDNWYKSSLSKQLSKMDIGTNIWLNAVHFVSPRIGWVVGGDGYIFNTVDGGKTWSQQKSHTQLFLYDVFFADKEKGWVVGKNGLVLHTSDGGQNWRPQRTDTTVDLTSIQMTNVNTGLISGQSGTVLKYEVDELQ